MTPVAKILGTYTTQTSNFTGYGGSFIIKEAVCGDRKNVDQTS